MKHIIPPLVSFVAWRSERVLTPGHRLVFHASTNNRSTTCGRALDDSLYIWPATQPPPVALQCQVCRRRLNSLKVIP